MKSYLSTPGKRRALRLGIYDALTVLGVFLVSYTFRIWGYEHGEFWDIPGRVSWCRFSD